MQGCVNRLVWLLSLNCGHAPFSDNAYKPELEASCDSSYNPALQQGVTLILLTFDAWSIEEDRARLAFELDSVNQTTSAMRLFPRCRYFSCHILCHVRPMMLLTFALANGLL